MIDIKLLRNDFDKTLAKLNTRNISLTQLELFKSLDLKYRALLTELQTYNAERNKKSISIGNLKRSVVQNGEVDVLQNGVKTLKDKITSIELEISKIDVQLKDILLTIPNIPSSDVIIGKDENDNKEIHKHGDIPNFDFSPLAHWDLAKTLSLYDQERAVKICGSRSILYTGSGAKLFRSLQTFTLDLNIDNGFYELLPPVLVKSGSLYGTGNLPKFEEDLYGLKDGGYLSPTGEVQMTNFHAGEILNYKDLPKRYTCNTACFRSEAGSAGRDTKGVIRQHQFYKTELVIISNQEDSVKEHEFMTKQAESILEALSLPYRRIMLCTGDMGFASTKTYDLEVWLPSYNAYKEISSCSNCTDFQTRNILLRYKDENNETKLCHSLNGSGLAIDRLWAAVVENYQQKDGSIKIPQPLLKYFNGQEYIK